MLEWTASAQEAFQNAKRLLAVAVPLQHPAPMLSFLSPLTPPILISEGSCSKNPETIGDHLDSFSANSQTQNHVIQLLTANHWPLRQQSSIFVLSVKVTFSNFAPTTNPLLPPCQVFLYQSCPDNSGIRRLFQSSMDNFLSSRFEKCCCQLLIPPAPPPPPAGSIAATEASRF